MTEITRIGLVLSARDLPVLKAHRPDIVLIPAGLALPEEEVAAAIGCPAYNLNRYTTQGAIAPASSRIAPFIRDIMADLAEVPLEALASQNDLYQYHLRLQFYFLQSLEAALSINPQAVLIITTQPYGRYWSPMRPEMGRLHDPARTYALLTLRLAKRRGMRVELPRSTGRLADRLSLPVRASIRLTLIEIYRGLQLVRKCWRSRSDGISRASVQERVQTGSNRPIGIIVRTDSEVVSASFLCRELDARGESYLLLQDEMLSSQTTRQRLQALGFSYVSLGSLTGLGGLVRAWLSMPRRLVSRGALAPDGDDGPSSVIAAPDVRAEMRRRLLDFALDQRHFAYELDAAIRHFSLRALVTYAYVDQWGAVIRETGRRRGLQTVAIQNAAQDPEEYPRLAWADHYCVESRHLKQRLIEMGYPEAALSATGLPQFAADLPKRIMSGNERQEKRAILVLTQPIYSRYFEAIIRLGAKVAADHDMRLIVKYHPRQSSSDYAEAIADARHCVDVDIRQRESLDDVLNEASLTISVVSAALFRAIYLGVPAFSLLPVEERHLDLDYVRHPVMRTVESTVELDTALREFLEDYGDRFESYEDARHLYLTEYGDFEPGRDPQANVADIVLRHANG